MAPTEVPLAPAPPGEGGRCGAARPRHDCGVDRGDELVGTPGGERAAFVEHQHEGRPLGLVEIGGGKDDAYAVRCGAGHEAPQIGPAHGVDAGRGLIEDEQLGLVDECREQSQFLSHPARQVAGEAVTTAGEAAALEQRAGAPLERSGLHPVGRGEERQVLIDGEVAVHAPVAGDVADGLLGGSPHPARARGDHAAERAQQRSCRRRHRR